MLSFAVYSDKTDDVTELKTIIQDFLIEVRMMAKVSVFNDAQTFLTIPYSYDVYIMDMDSADDVIELGRQMTNIDNGCRFIYVGTNKEKAYEASKIHADYFIAKPFDKEDVVNILLKIKQNIQFDNIIIKTNDGEKRIRVNRLNYINIVKRCLCYHLAEGAVFDGQVLRSSFEKAITPLQNHKAFLFLSPSLLINLGAIEEVRGDSAVFESGEVMYFPKKAYETVRNAWLNYTRILDM